MFRGLLLHIIFINSVVIWQPTASQSPFTWKTIYSTKVVVKWPGLSAESFNIRAERVGTDFSDCSGGNLDVSSPYEVSTTSSDEPLIAEKNYKIILCPVGGESNRMINGLTTGPKPPVIDSVSSPSPNQLLVQWTAHCDELAKISCPPQKDPEKYIITYTSTKDGSSYTEEILGDDSNLPATSITLDKNLESNAEYAVTVMTMTSFRKNGEPDKRIYTDASEIATGVTLPSQVDTPTAQPVSSSSVSLNWEDVAGNVDRTYTVSWEPSPGSGVSEIEENIKETSYQIDNLISNTLYTLKVIAVNEAGSGQESDSVTAATRIAIPQFFVAEPSTSSIMLTWDEPSGGRAASIDGYYLSWTSDGGDSNNDTVLSNENVIIASKSNDLFHISINAVSNEGPDGISTTISSTTLFAKPGPITIAYRSEVSVKISWTEPEEGGNAHQSVAQYFISCNSVNIQKDCSKIVEQASSTLDNLDSNTNYSIRIAARNEIDGSDGEFSDIQNAITLLNMPTSLVVHNALEQSIFVKWDEPEDGGEAVEITQYEVGWSGEDTNDGKNLTANFTSTEIPDLISNSKYDITVTAFGQQYGIPSNVLQAYTLPTKPVNPIATTLSSAIILLEWTNADNGTADKSYNVSWKSDQSEDHIDEIMETSKNISDLKSNSYYTLTVSAVNDGGTGGISDSAEAITLPAKANRPTSNSATVSSITLQWDEQVEGSVDRTYMVFWRVSENSVMYNETAASNNETTIKNLNGSTRYAFSLRSENEAGPASESSDEAELLTIPGKPQSANSSNGTDPTTTAIVNWRKPDGGDEIEGYTLEWTATSGDLPQDYVPHEKGNNSYTRMKTGLLPGEIYTVNITANNSRGSSSVERQHRAYPDSVSDLKAKKIEEDPSNSLNVTWVNPSSVGDKIKVEYTSQNDNNLETLETEDFDKTSLSIPVVPGNTYDINAYVISGNLTSINQPQHLRMNSKPSAVKIIDRDVKKYSIKLRWEFEGFAQSVMIEVVNNSQLNTEIKNLTQNEYTIMDLLPGTNYTVELYTMITNVANQKESSEITSEELQTMEEIIIPPPDVGLIVGLTVTGILLLVLIILGYLYYRRRRNGSKKPSVPTKPTTTQSPNNNGPYPPKERREVRLTDFKDHVESMQANSDMQFSAEYRQFSDVVSNPSVSASSQEENKPKNRYKNVLAYDATRVVLSNVSDAAEDYINANFIGGYRHDREYIAAQGPLPNTKDDFWKMVWEQDCKIIVMVTQTVEGGKVKCDHYWPYDNKTIAVADMTLNVLDEVDSGEWIVRKLELHKEYETRVINHFHYTAWPDHGVPKTTKSLVQFVQLVRNHIEKDGHNNGPPVVHCSAGVGRTGTFIAIDHLLQHLKEHPYVDIYGIVYEMRKQRNLMVQTEGQYIFLHDVVEDYLDKKFDEDQEPLYENAGFVKDPIYENTNYGGKPLGGSS